MNKVKRRMSQSSSRGADWLPGWEVVLLLLLLSRKSLRQRRMRMSTNESEKTSWLPRKRPLLRSLLSKLRAQLRWLVHKHHNPVLRVRDSRTVPRPRQLRLDQKALDCSCHQPPSKDDRPTTTRTTPTTQTRISPQIHRHPPVCATSSTAVVLKDWQESRQRRMQKKSVLLLDKLPYRTCSKMRIPETRSQSAGSHNKQDLHAKRVRRLWKR